jgi:hypothetical protein
MDEFKDLDIVCDDGKVRASSYVFSKFCGADIIVEAMRLDKTKLRMPFSVETMDVVVRLTHNCVEKDPNVLPIGDPHRLARIAEALDFIGCKILFERVLETIRDVLWRVPAAEIGVYLDPLLFKHSNDFFVRRTVEMLSRRFPFWYEFEELVMRETTFDARIAVEFLKATWNLFVPAVVISKICARMVIDLPFALKLLTSGFDNGTHPEEIGFVLEDVLKSMERLGIESEIAKSVANALSALKCCYSRSYSIPIRAVESGVCGSLVTYNDDQKFSVVVDLGKSAGGARRSTGPNLRRLAKGVRVSLERSGRVSAAFDIDEILKTSKRPTRIAARFVLERRGECIAERWAYHAPSPFARELVVTSDAPDMILPTVAGASLIDRFEEEFRRESLGFLRIDVYCARENNDYDGIVTAIEKKFHEKM